MVGTTKNEFASQPADTGSDLRIEKLSFEYGNRIVLDNIDLVIRTGEFVSLLGSSGCGKTTLLRLVAGLEPPCRGRILYGNRPITGPSPKRGVVFQDYALFPWYRLRENVALAVRVAEPNLPRNLVRARAEEYLEMVGLGHAARWYPHQLSGGMRQRGALARILALGSPVLLLDEPFGALDPVNRLRLQDVLLSVWAGGQLRRTVIFVTHDVEEALYLGDRVMVMGSSPGRWLGEVYVDAPRPRLREPMFASAAFRAWKEEISEYYYRDVQRQLDVDTNINTPGEGI